MAGEAYDAQLGIIGEKVVSPCHCNLWGNKVNLGGREGEGKGGREGGGSGKEGEREEEMSGRREEMILLMLLFTYNNRSKLVITYFVQD